jgi:hypothetical protein
MRKQQHIDAKNANRMTCGELETGSGYAEK